MHAIVSSCLLALWVSSSCGIGVFLLNLNIEFSIIFWEAVPSSCWFSINLFGLCCFNCSTKEYSSPLGPNSTVQTMSNGNAKTVVSPPLPALFLPSSLISYIQSVPCSSSQRNLDVRSKPEPLSLPPKGPKNLSVMCLPSCITFTYHGSLSQHCWALGCCCLVSFIM